jgi:hypothetical protein
MSKLSCLCGHLIADVTDNIPYKGYILPDTLLDKISTSLTASIDSLIHAIKEDKRLEWIKNHFSVPPYPTDLNDSSMIHDLFSSMLIDSKQDIFECEHCGRIAIQIGQSNRFHFFSPDSKHTKGVLNPKK